MLYSVSPRDQYFRAAAGEDVLRRAGGAAGPACRLREARREGHLRPPHHPEHGDSWCEGEAGEEQQEGESGGEGEQWKEE